jgi:NDP-sugar pyrophosphorylase family protein
LEIKFANMWAMDFGREPFAVLNADALMDVDLSKVIERHTTSKAQATMALKELTDSDDYTPVDLNDDGFVTGFGKGKYFFAGLQILGPEILDVLPSAGSPASIIDHGYRPLLSQGAKVAAFILQGYFNDIGTLRRYEQAKMDVAQGIFRPLV